MGARRLGHGHGDVDAEDGVVDRGAGGGAVADALAEVGQGIGVARRAELLGPGGELTGQLVVVAGPGQALPDVVSAAKLGLAVLGEQVDAGEVVKGRGADAAAGQGGDGAAVEGQGDGGGVGHGAIVEAAGLGVDAQGRAHEMADGVEEVAGVLVDEAVAVVGIPGPVAGRGQPAEGVLAGEHAGLAELALEQGLEPGQGAVEAEAEAGHHGRAAGADELGELAGVAGVAGPGLFDEKGQALVDGGDEQVAAGSGGDADADGVERFALNHLDRVAVGLEAVLCRCGVEVVAAAVGDGDEPDAGHGGEGAHVELAEAVADDGEADGGVAAHAVASAPLGWRRPVVVVVMS